MASLKTSELRALPEPDLRQRMVDVRKELTALRLKAHQGTSEQPHQIRQMRRAIARILTLLHESR